MHASLSLPLQDPTIESQEPRIPETTDEVSFVGKKKKGKGKKASKHVEDDDYGISNDVATLEEELIVASEDPTSPEITNEVTFSGKKKSKGKKGSKLLEDDDFALNRYANVFALGLEEESAVISDEEEPILFTGKKKAKKGKKDSSKKATDDEDYEIVAPPADTDVAVDSASVVEAAVSTSVGDQAAFVPEAEFGDSAQFGGKKKNKKGKKVSNVKDAGDDDIDAVLAQIETPKGQAPVVHVNTQSAAVDPAQSIASAASSKKKQKKGKKSGRTAQEEEDLDAILAQLDAQPEDIAAKSSPTEDAVAIQDADSVQDLGSTVDVAPSAVEGAGAEAGEVVESAAAKKKKKKKEKEKAKAAGGETQPESTDQVKETKQEDSKSKVPDKKLPKHVREMQERLAKVKELEEKRKREEEEKRRKEEEEQARLEELERQKEEAKRKRKEREKEKLLQKKKEGKLLNEKQKAEQRRLAAMREQFIAKTGTALAGDISTEEVVTKPKPKYETKKKKRPSGTQPSDGPADGPVDPVAVVEDQAIETKDVEINMDLEPVVEKLVEPEEIVEAVQEEDEDEDWDAKSWEQEVALPIIKSAFAEDEDLSLVGPSTSGRLAKSLSRQDSTRSAISRQDSANSTSVKGPGAPASKAVIKQQDPESDDGETESEEETDSDEDDGEVKKKREARAKREARKADALNKRSADDLRSPICCILGHVDTGKTKLLDCIRRTNVQEGEAGGITQQIGATYFPMENIRERTKELQSQAKLRVPGLLVIDTPGHESFTNLRARGSSLCDIAILVIDIMHGLEPQTIESLNLLKMRKTPFIVALNKVDRLYGWKTCLNAPIKDALSKQSRDVISEFEMRLSQIQTQLKEQGLNSELYYRNKEIRKVISVVPTSAISGEGVPDILMLLIQLTQKLMEDKLMYITEVQCTVLEVKVVEGLGTTIDVILVNGVLHEGDQIVVCGMQEPIVTNIRALLTPHPMKELRVKGSYQHHKELKAAQGIKLTAQGLEHAIAGTQLYVVGPDDDLEDIKDEAMQDMKNVMSRVDKSGEGVCVQASTLGSLEALLEFLKSPAVKIPVSGIGIGPVHKRDVMRASVMLERKRKEYATILAFDVKVSQEAKELAEETGVRIFMADIIYHLFDQFTAYMNSVKEEKRKESAEEAVFPCVLEILPNCVFNKKDPIVVGVNVLEGIAKVGTPICVPSKDPTIESRFINLGKIASIEVNHKEVDTAKKGQSVAMKIVGTNADESQKMVGRHFTTEDQLVSSLTRRSIDLLKENYRDDLSTDDWKLVVKLKRLFEIP